MFVCFGFLSLVKAYEFFNNEHVPYMVEQLAKAHEEEKQDIRELQPETTRVEEQNQTGTEEVKEVL